MCPEASQALRGHLPTAILGGGGAILLPGTAAIVVVGSGVGPGGCIVGPGRAQLIRAASSAPVGGGTEMDAGELFATAVPGEQLEAGWERALRRIFGPSRCLSGVERPRGAGPFAAVVQGRMREHWQKGLQFSSCSQWEKAIICYTKAIGLDPQRAELYEQRAEAFLQLCDFQSATLNFRKALALGPAREQHCLARLALVLDLQGQCLLDQELYSEALEAFTRAAELQPHRRVFRRRSILCLSALNKFPECLRMLNRDLAEDARNPDLYVLRASFYERFGQLSLCHQDVQRALELEPQHGAAQALRQRLQRRGLEAKAEAVSKALCGDLRGALLKISFAIETNPLAAEFFTLRGALLRRLKDFSAACKDLAKARQLCANEGPEAQEARRQLVLTYNDRAVHCYTLGRLDEAVMLLDCFLRLGELAHALADYQQALELSPGNLGVQRRVAATLHELGRQDVVARRYQQAEARFSAAIEHDPREALHYLHRARARLCLWRVQSAREDAVRSLRLDPTDSEILSLAHHLFPRTTVQAILRSETGRLAQETVEETLQSPPEPTTSAGDAWCDSSRFPRKWRPREAQQSWPSQSLRGLTSRRM
ncbi:tetratricopeptide repeat protein 16 isoform X2 [Oxyura jamaicensis]|uniref:tetratricopeptide repeat protein 16 isoform X2 n=1 Tax=Oxyura jamaicensis TaxID=8884 RepID=UPI0015A57BD3|nr:tetratricopeptide repeat protein 16 isoform X2 [Oxyura jamaicensis]